MNPALRDYSTDKHGEDRSSKMKDESSKNVCHPRKLVAGISLKFLYGLFLYYILFQSTVLFASDFGVSPVLSIPPIDQLLEQQTTAAAQHGTTTNDGVEPASQSATVWQQKFTVIDEKNKVVGTIESSMEKYEVPYQKPYYGIRTMTDTISPYWFLAGNTKTEENEYYDDKFMPLVFEFKAQSPAGTVESQGKLYPDKTELALSTKTVTKKYNMRLKSGNTIKKVSLPVLSNVCTFGNLRSVMQKRGARVNKTYTLQLLDKNNLKYRKITVTITKKFKIADKTFYVISLVTGKTDKFSITVDENFNIISGKGMGIKLIPVD